MVSDKNSYNSSNKNQILENISSQHNLPQLASPLKKDSDTELPYVMQTIKIYVPEAYIRNMPPILPTNEKDNVTLIIR